MELYIWIHVCVILSLLFEICRDSKLKRKVIILWCIFFTLFGGLRWEIGGDWHQYHDHFLNASWGNIFTYDRYGNGRETMEPGFMFLNVLVKTIFGNFYYYNLLVVGFIQYTYFKFSCKLFPEKPLFVYVFLMTFVGNYFPVRAGLSQGIIFWVYIYMMNGENKKMLLPAVCATLIHYQSAIILPFFFLHRIKLNYVVACAVYFCVFLMSWAFQDYFKLLSIIMGGEIGDKVEIYTNVQTINFEESSGFGLLGFVLNFLFLSTFFYVKKSIRIEDGDWYQRCINGFMIYICIYMVFSHGMGDLTRLANIYYPCQVILFWYSFKYFFYVKSKQSNRIYSYIAVFFVIVYLIYRLPTNWTGYFFMDTCVPYKSIFEYNNIN